jgi:hypothetical protein
VYTLLDLRGSIPASIRVTIRDTHDVNIIDQIAFQPRAYDVMDLGYRDYLRLHRIHLIGAVYLTRAKTNLDGILSVLPSCRQASQRLRRPFNRAQHPASRSSFLKKQSLKATQQQDIPSGGSLCFIKVPVMQFSNTRKC